MKKAITVFRIVFSLLFHVIGTWLSFTLSGLFHDIGTWLYEEEKL